MHQEILSKTQTELLPLVARFKRDFYLVGGTAIALHIGHRRSIDFDLFKSGSLNHKKILDTISSKNLKYVVARRVEEQLNLIVNDVKFTFFQFPYSVTAVIKFKDYFRMPSLLDLAAMKAFALGRRAKWKDYIDMYFILHDHFSVEQIAERASAIFGQLFSEKQFRAQLCYFEDVDYTEPVDFMATPLIESEIKDYLTQKAIDIPL